MLGSQGEAYLLFVEHLVRLRLAGQADLGHPVRMSLPGGIVLG
jgi:hypothetical protein